MAPSGFRLSHESYISRSGPFFLGIKMKKFFEERPGFMIIILAVASWGVAYLIYLGVKSFL